MNPLRSHNAANPAKDTTPDLTFNALSGARASTATERLEAVLTGDDLRGDTTHGRTSACVNERVESSTYSASAEAHSGDRFNCSPPAATASAFNDLSGNHRGRPADLLPSSIGNMGFMIAKLSEDCSATQFLREFTQNGIDAIGHLPGASGDITWDVDLPLQQATGRSKLCCIDTGIGMTGPEMVDLLPNWFRSGQVQSSTANFGVGGKVSAFTRNREGITYQSWRNGQGAMVHLRYDAESDTYGLTRWPNNHGEFWTPLAENSRPEGIQSHGTKVTFHGNSSEEDTVQSPPGVGSPARWIARALNTRYFRLPTTIRVQAREGCQYDPSDTRHNFLRRIEGQGAWLDRNAEAKGQTALNNATAHWWILREGTRGAGEIAHGGHMAVLFQNELYEMTHGRAGMARLQAFGAIFGADRVVIYLEPAVTAHQVPKANAARTQVKIGGEAWNWGELSGEFRERLPQALVDLQHEIGSRSGERDYREAIKSRLKQAIEFLGLMRLCPNSAGTILVRPANAGETGENRCVHSEDFDRSPAGVLIPGRRPGVLPHYLRRLVPGGSKPARIEPDLGAPTVHWISAEAGTRSHGDLVDRAARYLFETDTILINQDFGVFTSMLERWRATYAHVHGSRKAVGEVVQEWFEQQLIEVVLGAKALGATGRWSSPEQQALWSETALTAAVLPRWHIDSSIGRALSHRFGSASRDA